MEEIFGYVRTSKVEQCENRQIDALLKYGVKKENIYVEK